MGGCGPQTLEAKGPHGATRGPLILQAFNNPSAAAATFASNVAGAPLLPTRNERTQELCLHSALAASSVSWGGLRAALCYCHLLVGSARKERADGNLPTASLFHQCAARGSQANVMGCRELQVGRSGWVRLFEVSPACSMLSHRRLQRVAVKCKQGAGAEAGEAARQLDRFVS